jgi:hypothetical protein
MSKIIGTATNVAAVQVRIVRFQCGGIAHTTREDEGTETGRKTLDLCLRLMSFKPWLTSRSHNKGHKMSPKLKDVVD